MRSCPVWKSRLGQVLAVLTVCGAIAAQTASGVSIYDIQYTTDPSGSSPLVGQIVTTSGVVTGTQVAGFTMADGAGSWRGIWVYTYLEGPAIGDSVQVTGTVQEYAGMTRITLVTGYQLFSTGHAVVPTPVAAADAGQEAYESVLLQLDAVTVTELRSYGEWVVDSVLVCDDVADYVYFPQVGDALDSLTGVLVFTFGVFKLEPRNTSDIAGAPIPHYALHGDVVTMNDARDVLSGHYVEILGDRIVAVQSTPPAGVLTVETGGLIFPGLIDAHNHPSYNVLDLIPFGETFQDRYEWRATPIYSAFGDQLDAMDNYGNPDLQILKMYKLAELRALSAGTTTIQGVNCNGDAYAPFAHQGIGINNAERFPARLHSVTFPLWETPTYWQNKAGQYYWDRFVVHLAEGINAAALAEFATWQSLCPLDERTTIVHGVALGASEWAALASAGGHLVWSPRSNVVLYGQTADVPGALSAGVNVALAPDWTESGSPHVLDEMRYARTLGDSLWGGVLTAQMITEMVTRNAADALGSDNRIGQVAVGYQADLMVVPGSWAAPYDALLAAEPLDVELTVVSGRPMYGDPSLIAGFPFLSDTEDIVVGGATKRLATAIDAYSINYSDMAAADFIADLEAAYAASYPPVCCFIGIEPAPCARAPVAYPNSYLVEQGATFVVDAPGVLGNDFDGDWDPLEAVLESDVSHGTLALAADGGFVYDHDGADTTPDSFAYRATDGGLFSEPATVNLLFFPSTSVAEAVSPSAQAWLRIHPNPFNPVTSIRFAIPRPGPVFIAVHDVSGRRIAVLTDGPREAGEHEVAWDGRNAAGEEAASGIYFTRMVAGGFTTTRKMVMIK